MKLCAKFFTVAALIGTLGAGSVAGEKKGSAKSKEKSATDLVPIPVGHKGSGIKLPMYDIAGKLQLMFYIENAYRNDLAHMEMKNTKVETYDENEEVEMTIDLSKSVLDLETKIIRSQDPVTIRRSDFEITGETMRFNTATKEGKMIGKVRMLIYNRDEMASGEDSKASK